MQGQLEWFDDFLKGGAYARAYACAFRILRKKEDAEEVTNEACARVFRKFSSGNVQRRSLLGYLRVAVTRLAIDLLKSRRPQDLSLNSTVDVDDAAVELGDRLADLSALPPDLLYVDGEFETLLREARTHLSPLHRMIFDLTWVEDNTIKEVCDFLKNHLAELAQGRPCGGAEAYPAIAELANYATRDIPWGTVARWKAEAVGAFRATVLTRLIAWGLKSAAAQLGEPYGFRGEAVPLPCERLCGVIYTKVFGDMTWGKALGLLLADTFPAQMLQAFSTLSPLHQLCFSLAVFRSHSVEQLAERLGHQSEHGRVEVTLDSALNCFCERLRATVLQILKDHS